MIKNTNQLELLKGSLVAFFIKSSGLLFNFLLIVFIARQAGAEGLGIFTLAYTVLQLVTIIAKIGLDAGLVKFVAQFQATNTPELLNSTYSKSLLLVLLSASLVGGIIYGCADFVSTKLLHQPALVPYLKHLAYFVVPFSVVFITGETLRGLKKIRVSVIITSTLIFLFSFIAILRLPTPLDPFLAFTYFCYAIAVTALIGLYAVRQAGIRFTLNQSLLQRMPTKQLLAFSLPMFLVISLNVFSKQINILLLGLLGTISDVGIFDVAMKVAILTAIPLTAVNSIAAPKLSESYAQKDPIGLRQIALQSSKLTMLASSPILIICLIFPSFILQIFGNEFVTNGVVALRIIVIAQFINAAAGPVAYVLQMTEHQNIVGKIMLFSTTICIGLNFLLIPLLGVTGAAIAYAGSLVIWNIGCLFAIKQKLGFFAVYIPSHFSLSTYK